MSYLGLTRIRYLHNSHRNLICHLGDFGMEVVPTTFLRPIYACYSKVLKNELLNFSLIEQLKIKMKPVCFFQRETVSFCRVQSFFY